MNKLIIGLVGEIASGKGTVSRYLAENLGAEVFRYSTILRDVLNRLHIEQNRSNLQLVSKVLRENFGQDLLARVIAADASKANSSIVVVDGIRRLEDLTHLQQLNNFILVKVMADLEVRWQRIRNRHENPDDQNKTLEQFKADHEKETEQTIPSVMAIAHESLDNNGDEASLINQVEALLKKYRS